MNFIPPSLNLLGLLPVLFLIGYGLFLLIADLFVPKEQKEITGWLTFVGLGISLVTTIRQWGTAAGSFTPQNGYPMLVIDNYAIFLNGLFLLAGMITVLISINYLKKADIDRGEYYLLTLFAISGMMLMGMANDLILVFLALELLSIPLYVLSGFAARYSLQSEESAMKYFLLGAFSSGIFVFGIALLYGAVGSTALPEIALGLGNSFIGIVGFGMVLVGFAFKVGAVPFHMWTPDVYEGAPTAVTGFMSVGAKIGGFAAMIRFFAIVLSNPQNHALGVDAWLPIILLIAAFTMMVGNVVALVQSNIKRMLAYSSIAHAGYILMAVASMVGSGKAVPSALFYMLAYLFTNLGVFAIISIVEKERGEGVGIDDFKGLATRSPWLAGALAYFMLSLTGIPPTGGFTAKFYVFQAALEANLLGLAFIGVITSAVSGYFYMRIVYLMYMYEGDGVVNWSQAGRVAVIICVVGTILLGVMPAPWLAIVEQALFAPIQILAGG